MGFDEACRLCLFRGKAPCAHKPSRPGRARPKRRRRSRTLLPMSSNEGEGGSLSGLFTSQIGYQCRDCGIRWVRKRDRRRCDCIQRSGADRSQRQLQQQQRCLQHPSTGNSEAAQHGGAESTGTSIQQQQHGGSDRRVRGGSSRHEQDDTTGAQLYTPLSHITFNNTYHIYHLSISIFLKLVSSP